MKQIINGRKYDTQTAKELGTKSYGYTSDFGYFCETLYLKRNGEFFLYGTGGPASKYCKCVGDGYSGGENITPLTEIKAKTWAEKNLMVEEYEKIFGEVEE